MDMECRKDLGTVWPIIAQPLVPCVVVLWLGKKLRILVRCMWGRSAWYGHTNESLPTMMPQTKLLWKVSPRFVVPLLRSVSILTDVVSFHNYVLEEQVEGTSCCSASNIGRIVAALLP